MPIYTGTGDSGETGLFGGGRVRKDHPRVEATGAVDELNAVLGRARRIVASEDIGRRLQRIQEDLFLLGANISTAPGEGGEKHPHVPDLPRGRTAEMERWIDDASAEAGPLGNFVLPGGSAGAAELHVARTVCRRAERRVAELGGAGEHLDPEILRYLNRLSDLLFAWARLENRVAGVPDLVWRGRHANEGED